MSTPQSALGVNPGQQSTIAQTDNKVPAGANAFNSERPLNVKPAPEGGVAIDGQAGLQEGHASIADKMIGKMEKVKGKYTHDPALHERGELRESGGEAAELGTARAPHD